MGLERQTPRWYCSSRHGGQRPGTRKVQQRPTLNSTESTPSPPSVAMWVRFCDKPPQPASQADASLVFTPGNHGVGGQLGDGHGGFGQVGRFFSFCRDEVEHFHAERYARPQCQAKGQVDIGHVGLEEDVTERYIAAVG